MESEMLSVVRVWIIDYHTQWRAFIWPGQTTPGRAAKWSHDS